MCLIISAAGPATSAAGPPTSLSASRHYCSSSSRSVEVHGSGGEGVLLVAVHVRKGVVHVPVQKGAGRGQGRPGDESIRMRCWGGCCLPGVESRACGGRHQPPGLAGVCIMRLPRRSSSSCLRGACCPLKSSCARRQAGTRRAEHAHTVPTPLHPPHANPVHQMYPPPLTCGRPRRRARPA